MICLSVGSEHGRLDSGCPYSAGCWELWCYSQDFSAWLLVLPSLRVWYCATGNPRERLVVLMGLGWYHQRNLRRIPGQVWTGLSPGSRGEGQYRVLWEIKNVSSRNHLKCKTIYRSSEQYLCNEYMCHISAILKNITFITKELKTRINRAWGCAPGRGT